MNLIEAREVLKEKSREREYRKNLREWDERIKFLQKWIQKYSEELRDVKEFHSLAREFVKHIPTDARVRQAQDIVDTNESIDKELKKLKAQKRKYK